MLKTPDNGSRATETWGDGQSGAGTEGMDRESSEEGLARGEGGSAQREFDDVESSSPVPADTCSPLNRADDHPESPSCAAYAVVPAQPMTYAATAGYEDVNAPDGEQSSAKSAPARYPLPACSWIC